MALDTFLETHSLKQRELAESLGVSEATVSRIVNGEQFPRKPLLDSILSFCRQRDPSITYEQLFGAEREEAA